MARYLIDNDDDGHWYLMPEAEGCPDCAREGLSVALAPREAEADTQPAAHLAAESTEEA